MNDHKIRCLNYIQAYIKSKDQSCHRFRGFVDEWYGHHKGGCFLTRKRKDNQGERVRWLNNPDITKDVYNKCMRDLHVVSEQALKILKRKGSEPLIKEHAIPIKKLRELVFLKLNSNSKIECIEQFLLTYYRVGAITKKEDLDVNKKGLKDCMPTNWDSNEPRGLYARYDKAKIKYQVNPIEG